MNRPLIGKERADGGNPDGSRQRWPHNALMRESWKRKAAAAGIVEWFSEEEGWGALSAPEVPGGCFVHFSSIQAEGYQSLRSGQQVTFTFEQPGFFQDGYPYRALAVWPDR